MATQKELESQVKKELRRIKAFIKNAEKRGYQFEENVIPAIPKNVTQATVRRFQNIKPETLYKKATAVNPNTGEIISGTAYRNIERYTPKELKNAVKAMAGASVSEPKTEERKQSEKRLDDFTAAKIIVNNVLTYIDNILSPSLRVRYRRAVTSTIEMYENAEDGYIAVADALQAMPQDVRYYLTDPGIPSGEGPSMFGEDLAAHLPFSPFDKDEIIKDLSEQEDTGEDWDNPFI